MLVGMKCGQNGQNNMLGLWHSVYDELTCTAAAAAGRTAGAGPASARGGTAAGRPPGGTPASAPAHTTAPPAPAPAPALHLYTLLPRHVLAHLPRHHAATTRG